MLRMPLSGSDPPSESDSDPAAETRPGASAVTWTRAGRGDRGPWGGGLSAAATRNRDEALPAGKPPRLRCCRVGLWLRSGSSPTLLEPALASSPPAASDWAPGHRLDCWPNRPLPSVAETDHSSAMPSWGPAGA